MKIKKILFHTAVFGFFIVLAGLAGYWQSRSLENERNRRLALPAPIALPDFFLTDQDGHGFTRDDLLGHWNILFFGYTRCPDLCPPTLHKLAQLMDQESVAALSRPLQVVFISVDPAWDGPRLSSYLSTFHRNVTGLYGDHASLGKVFGVYALPAAGHADHASHADYAGHADHAGAAADPAVGFDHTQSLFLIDPAGRWHARRHASFVDGVMLSEWLSWIDRQWHSA